MKKFLFLMFACFLLGGCSHRTPNQPPAPPPMDLAISVDNSATDESVFITNVALSSYREKYKQAKDHKAFAQSESGAWSWKSDRTTREYAMKNALMGCQANNRLEKEYPCKIIDVDGNWVNK